MVKWILLGVVVLAVIAVGTLVFFLRNKTQDVSRGHGLEGFLDTPLTTARPGELWLSPDGTMTARLVAKPEGTVQGPIRVEVPAGTPLRIDNFVTVENQLAGLIHVEARGEITVDGKARKFTYQWSHVQPELPRALWQTDAAPRVRFTL